MHLTPSWRHIVCVRLAHARPFGAPTHDSPEALSPAAAPPTPIFTPFEGKTFGIVIILMVLLPIAIAIIGAYIEQRFGDGSITISQRKKSAHWGRVADRLRKKRDEQLEGWEVNSKFRRFLRRWIYVTPDKHADDQAIGGIQSPFGSRGYGIDDEPISNTIPPGGGTMVPPGPQTLTPMRNIRPPSGTVPPAGPRIPPIQFPLDPRRLSVPPAGPSALKAELIPSPKEQTRDLHRPNVTFAHPKEKGPEKQQEPTTAENGSPQLSPTQTDTMLGTRSLCRKHRKRRSAAGGNDSLARQRLRHVVEKSFGEMACLVGTLYNPDLDNVRSRAMKRKKSMSSHL